VTNKSPKPDDEILYNLAVINTKSRLLTANSGKNISRVTWRK